MRECILAELDDERFTATVLGERLCLSRSQVYHKIKVRTGLSTALFIRSVRLEQACRLLLNSCLTISEIAYRVGFRSPVYFSQVFKLAFGKSPTQVRNQQ